MENTLSPKELSELAHKLGHEIGNPLTAIISLATIIERFGVGLPPEQLADFVAKSSGHAGIIIKEAWKISSLSDKIVMLFSQKIARLENKSLRPLIEEALHRLKTRAALDTADIQIEGEELEAFVEPVQFVFLIQELLSNALQCEIYEGKNPDSPIKLRLSKSEDSVKLSVENSSKIPRAFPLSELSQPLITSWSDFKHLGLGLAACKNILARSQGNIEFLEQAQDNCYLFKVSIGLPLNI